MSASISNLQSWGMSAKLQGKDSNKNGLLCILGDIKLNQILQITTSSESNECSWWWLIRRYVKLHIDAGSRYLIAVENDAVQVAWGCGCGRRR